MGWVAGEDHGGILRAVLWAGWPDQEPGWPASLEGVSVFRVTDAEANVSLPWALHAALIHWLYHRRTPPPPQPEPLTKAEAQVTAGPTADGSSGRGVWRPPAGFLGRHPLGQA